MYEIDKTYYEIENLPVRIVHLSDIHNNPRWEFLYSAVTEEKPEIIVITGDIAGRNNEYSNSLKLIAKLSSICPILFVSGNHERGINRKEVLKDLKKIGVINLDDKTIKIKDIRFTGLNKNRAFPHEASSGFNILLVHEPENIKMYANYDLILSGHAHGGQWRFFNRGIYSTSQGLFPKLTSGMNINNMIINRGCGDITSVPRINNNHEIIILSPSTK